jgi:Ni/Co efflux regulator RcnB
MRRILFAVLVSAVALAIVPATSLADHDRGEHHRRDREREHRRDHERRHERRHHHKVRQVRLGHTPIVSGDHSTAGMIKSFDGTVLTITLNDGTDVSGTVADFTRITCDAPGNMVNDDHGRDGGGNSGPGNSGDRGDQGDDRGDQGDQGDDRGDDNSDEQMCSTTDLMPGATVQDAELRISGAGSFWEEVELASQP